jgi:hypothetical protein
MPTASDPVLSTLKAHLGSAVTAAAAELGCSPHTVDAGLVGGTRHATLTFGDTDDMITWAEWLHWPFAVTARDGTYMAQANGQWLGFACHLAGSEPLIPVPAPAAPVAG